MELDLEEIIAIQIVTHGGSAIENKRSLWVIQISIKYFRNKRKSEKDTHR